MSVALKLLIEKTEAALAAATEPKKKGKGTTAVIEAAPRPSEDAWMRNLNTSPAVFLQQRFEQESAAKTGGAP